MEPKDLDKIAEKVSRLSIQDHIFSWDQKQANPETAVICKFNPKHGALQAHGDGNVLICCNVKPKNEPPCGYTAPISR